MTALAMFPLGSVLLPHMPIMLRVFEPRYLDMLAAILPEEPSEFGVVLIERGQEVGGGEQRLGIATMAEITELDTADDMIVLVAEGGRRVRVTEWLEDDPYPRALAEELPELEWDDSLLALRGRAESAVRRLLAQASEFGDQQWSAAVELSDEPVAAAWQLAGIAPFEEYDRVRLLGCDTLEELLERTAELAEDAAVSFP